MKNPVNPVYSFGQDSLWREQFRHGLAPAHDMELSIVHHHLVDTMIELAEEGMTMLCVTHEMGFAQAVANRVIFMDQGQIVEQNEPKAFFNNPQSDRTKLFLSQILGH